eukprot:TRINITY_DN2484_c0_g1_i3.p1 TRINITY_DN2484_c0_g1~~TRINITY_DN2484_c0_g1_i3.p1  ORF type:complete len:228 (-),score=19.43 TRINITY_DN2484_c0_g1_i3:292-975(-)
MFGNSSFVVSGAVVDKAFSLDCPSGDAPPVYALPGGDPQPIEGGEDGELVLYVAPDFSQQSNTTAIVDVTCVHKGTITCLTPSGYQVKNAGDTIDEECLVYIHSIDTITSCGYFFDAGDQFTFFMKSDGDTPDAGSCYQSTYALENYVYNAISNTIPDTCPYGVIPECPVLRCFNVVDDACCDGQFSEGEYCWVDRVRLSYEYKGICEGGKQVFQRENSAIGACYCA